MKKIKMRAARAGKLILASSVILAAGFTFGAEDAKSLIENSSFEKTKPYTVPEKVKDLFVVPEIPEKWQPNSNNPSKITVISDAETSHGGSNYIRIEQIDSKRNSAFYYVAKIKVNATEKYSLSVWAKGEGQLILMCYAFNKDASIPGIGGDSFRKISSKEWQEQKIEFTVPAGVDCVSPAFHTQGSVDLDDAKFYKID